MATVKAPPGWKVERGGKRMSRRLVTKDFVTAVGLLRKVAKVAEDVGHHPDLHLERWNRLRITTWSHDVGKLTPRDANLARRLNAVLPPPG